MPERIRLFTLETFKSTGGVQNMTRTMAYALGGYLADRPGFQFWSLYDDSEDLNEAYVSPENFRAFDGNKLSFFKKLWQFVKWPDLSIISHINLAIAGLIVKRFNSKCQVWLVAHGIEVWGKLSPIKRAFLKRCDKIICVSEFTKQQMIARHQVPENKCVVLNNALDPYFFVPKDFEKSSYLMQRYGLSEADNLLFTLTRINSAEHYKGYDKVIAAVAGLKADFPNLKYILAGKSDEQERDRLKKLIEKHQLQENVILTGFIDNEELTHHFLLADVFVMPSKGEGFGIVLIEAAANGTPVICGNADGSIDAIKNGELGVAVDPDDEQGIIDAIRNTLSNPLSVIERKRLQEKCLAHFNANLYKEKLNQLIYND